MKKYYLGVLSVLIAALGNALLPIFTILAYDGNVNVSTILVIRFTLTTVFLFLFIVLTGRHITITRSYLTKVILLSGVFFTASSILYLSSVKYISASLAVLCVYSYPVFVAILSAILEKEKLTNRLLISIIIGIWGLVLVLGSSLEITSFKGILMAVGSGVCYSIYIVNSNRSMKQASPIVTAAFITLTAMSIMLVLAVVTNSLDFNFARSAWATILGISLFSTLVSIVAFLYGVELLGSIRASVLSMIEPLITFAFGAVLFHDRFSSIQWIGSILVLTEAMLVAMMRDKNMKRASIPDV